MGDVSISHPWTQFSQLSFTATVYNNYSWNSTAICLEWRTIVIVDMNEVQTKRSGKRVGDVILFTNWYANETSVWWMIWYEWCNVMWCEMLMTCCHVQLLCVWCAWVFTPSRELVTKHSLQQLSSLGMSLCPLQLRYSSSSRCAWLELEPVVHFVGHVFVSCVRKRSQHGRQASKSSTQKSSSLICFRIIRNFCVFSFQWCWTTYNWLRDCRSSGRATGVVPPNHDT